MKLRPTKDCIKLFQDGALALAQVERNGMRVDTRYLLKTQEKTAKKIKKIEKKLMGHKIYKTFLKTQKRPNLWSLEQLGDVVFNHLGYPSLGKTKTGRHKTDEEAFEHVDLDFVKDHIRMRKLDKIKGTYLEGIRRELVGDVLHPNFNLNLAKSGRSSSDTPNSQNFPVRDPYLAGLVRRCFIPWDDMHYGEFDFKGIEVCIGACYHKDPTMIKYIEDETRDMHRDMAMQCYKLKEEQVSKNIRYSSKNMWVFPQFYGDYYIRCAIALWEAIDRLKLETTDGVPLRKHLRRHGIKALGDCNPKEPAEHGTLEHHLKKVEEDFWGKRFKVYKKWKDDFWAEFQTKGCFLSKTGFFYQGMDSGGTLRKNQVVNFPIQGSAFHCLLWTLIQLQKWMTKYKMKSRLTGQIHDSILGSFHRKEVQDILNKVTEIISRDLPRHWPWICVPLKSECELAPLGMSWFDKEEWVQKKGVWAPKEGMAT